MRNIKDVLRLSESGLNKTQIKKLTGVSRKTAREYLSRCQAAGIRFSDCKDISDSELYELLFEDRIKQKRQSKSTPNWPVIHRELKRKSVTLALLWEELVANDPNAYSYGRFCHHYREWKKPLDASMRQNHKAGEKVFVDFAGQTVPIIDQETGEIQHAQVFVAALGASSYSYAQAVWTQSLPDWIRCNCNMFEYFGGVPEIIVPDNLKSGVNKACRYEPALNHAYHDFALHYAVAVMPTRVRRPKDKAKVENGVLVVERWILAALRNHTFFNLTELNKHIHFLLDKLNNKKFQKMEGSRKSVYESVEKEVLRPLPDTRYEYAEYKKAKVNIDYHIEVDGHYYSVPYRQIGNTVDIQIASRTIAVYKESKQIAIHPRSRKKGRHSTIPEHMPKAHQEYGQWTPNRIISWSQSLGQSVGELVQKVIARKEHPAQGYRSALGIIRLEKSYGKQRLETACKKALQCGSLSYPGVKSILEKGLDKNLLEQPKPRPLPKNHANIRGASAFTEKQFHVSEGAHNHVH